MKKEIIKYLKSKEKTSYNNFDKILENYSMGKIKKMLIRYKNVGIYLSFKKENISIQLSYRYNNINVVIDFFSDKYNVVIYHTGINKKDLEKLFKDYIYQDDFSLNELINEIDIEIKNHPKLIDITIIEKKKKLYSKISSISLYFPLVLIAGLSCFCIITKTYLTLNVWWVILFIIIPLIIWFVFDIKSTKL